MPAICSSMLSSNPINDMRSSHLPYSGMFFKFLSIFIQFFYIILIDNLIFFIDQNKLKILKKCFSIMDSSNFNIHYLPKIWKIVNMKHWPKTANFLIVPICHGCFSKKYLSLKINEVVLTNRVNQSTLTKIGPYMKKMRNFKTTLKKRNILLGWGNLMQS